MNSGHVAFVTGGASRVGCSICRSFASRGYHVLIHCNKSLENANKLKEELRAEHPSIQADVVQCDLLDDASVESMIGEIGNHPLVASSGGLKVIVLNASIYELSVLSSSEGTDDAEVHIQRENDIKLFSNMHKVHVESSYRIVTGLLPHLKRAAATTEDTENKENKDADACVVAITDTSQGRSWHGLAAYTCAKAGLQQLMVQLSGDLAPQRIRFNCCAPGPVAMPNSKTVQEEMKSILAPVALKRLAQGSEVAECVQFLVSCKYMTGQVVKVDGGLSIGQPATIYENT